MPSIKSWLSSTAPRAPRQRAVKRADPKHIARERPPFWRGEARQERGRQGRNPSENSRLSDRPRHKRRSAAPARGSSCCPSSPAMPGPLHTQLGIPRPIPVPGRSHGEAARQTKEAAVRLIVPKKCPHPTSHNWNFHLPAWSDTVGLLPVLGNRKFLLLIPSGAPGAFVSPLFRT